MSYKAMDAVMEMEELSATDFKVLMALAYRQNHTTGRCNPSYETIAKDARCSRATVHTTLSRLRDNGMVTWNTIGNGKKNKHNEYFLHLTKSNSQTCSPEPSPIGEPSKSNWRDDQVQLASETKSDCWTVTRKLNKEEEQGKNITTGKMTCSVLSLNPKAVEEHMIEKEALGGKSDYKKAVEVAETIREALIKEGRKVNKLSNAIIKRNTEIAPKWFLNLVQWVNNNSDWDELTKQVTEEIANNTFFSQGYLGWVPDLGWFFNYKDGEMGVEKVLNGKYNHMRKGVVRAAAEAELNKTQGKAINTAEVSGEQAVQNAKTAGFTVISAKAKV
jgi:predicted transcriptional regulator